MIKTLDEYIYDINNKSTAEILTEYTIASDIDKKLAKAIILNLIDKSYYAVLHTNWLKYELTRDDIKNILNKLHSLGYKATYLFGNIIISLETKSKFSLQFKLGIKSLIYSSLLAFYIGMVLVVPPKYSVNSILVRILIISILIAFTVERTKALIYITTCNINYKKFLKMKSIK